MNRLATGEEALAFVREHGIVLVSATGSAPKLTEAIIGEPIQGSWWAHPQGRHIFTILRAVSESEDVLVCRLVKGKVTLVHRRLWPALVRLTDRFGPAQLARVREEHTPSGRHVNREIAFPRWVPPEVAEQGEAMSEKEALVALASWVPAASTRLSRGKGRVG
ncbi:MAG TPA: hypothetical protein VGN24_04445 [Rhodanobacter sp.]|jgi:hypothetical protein|nr:hypothetical protein [Rhodanobacter sp.]